MKKFIVSIFSILIIVLFEIDSYAASLSISTSKSEVTIGDTVTVTVSFGQKVAAADVVLTYDTEKFSYKSVSAGTANNSGSQIKVSYYDSNRRNKPNIQYDIYICSSGGRKCIFFS